MIAGVLLLLNTYPLIVSEDLVFRSKETTMAGSVSVMVYSLSGLNRLTQENVEAAMAVVEETGLSRILVTDSAGLVLYDTRETGGAVGKYTFYSEVVQALEEGLPPEAALGTIQQATRRYAKRQMTWFRANPAVQWLDASAGADEIFRAALQKAADFDSGI